MILERFMIIVKKILGVLLMLENIIEKANRNYNEEKWNLIINRELKLKDKVKKHDDLFNVYIKRLKATRDLEE